MTASTAPTLTPKQHEGLTLLAGAPDGLRVANTTTPETLHYRVAQALTQVDLAHYAVLDGSRSVVAITPEGRSYLLAGDEISDAAGEAPDPAAASPEPDREGTHYVGDDCPDGHEPPTHEDCDFGDDCVSGHHDAPTDPDDDACPDPDCTSCTACLDCGGQVFDEDGMCVPCQVTDAPTYQSDAPAFPSFEGLTVRRGSASLTGQIPDLEHASALGEEIILVARASVSKVTHEQKAKGLTRVHVFNAGEDVYALTGDAIAQWCRDENLPDLTPEAILRAAQRHAIDERDRRAGKQQLPGFGGGARGGEPAHVSEALAEIADGLNRDELEARDEDGRRVFDVETGEEALLVGRLEPPATDADQWELVTDNARMGVGFTREHAEAQARTWFGDSIEFRDRFPDGDLAAIEILVLDQDDLLAAAGADNEPTP